MSPRRPHPPGLDPRPAPGHLAVVQDFINTRDVESGRDALRDRQSLEAWLVARQLMSGDERVDEEDWRHALVLREGLRRIIQSHLRGRHLEPSAIAELNHLTSALVLHHRFHFGADGAPRLVAATAGWPGAMTRLLGWIAEAHEKGRWQRLKECASESCRRVFYDGASNQSGKWCNARRCGNRVHTATYRRRGPKHWRNV